MTCSVSMSCLRSSPCLKMTCLVAREHLVTSSRLNSNHSGFWAQTQTTKQLAANPILFLFLLLWLWRTQQNTTSAWVISQRSKGRDPVQSSLFGCKSMAAKSSPFGRVRNSDSSEHSTVKNWYTQPPTFFELITLHASTSSLPSWILHSNKNTHYHLQRACAEEDSAAFQDQYTCVLLKLSTSMQVGTPGCH